MGAWFNGACGLRQMDGSEAAASLPSQQQDPSLTQLRETQDGDETGGDGQACGRTCPTHQV